MMIVGLSLIKLCLLLSYVTAITAILGNYPDDSETLQRFYTQSCDLAFDLMVIIDLTYSNSVNLKRIKRELTSLVDTFLSPTEQNRLSLAAFRDKPVPPFGHSQPEWEDTCFEILTFFGDTVEKQKKTISELKTGGGYDFADGQLDALFRAAAAPEWLKEEIIPGEAERIRVIVMITDSIPHYPKDYRKVNSGSFHPAAPYTTMPYLRNFDEIASDFEKNYDLDFGCKTYDYPSLDNIERMFTKTNIMPMFLLLPKFACDGDQSSCDAPGFENYGGSIQERKSEYLIWMKSTYSEIAKSTNHKPVVEFLGQNYMSPTTNFAKNFLGDIMDQELISCNCLPNIYRRQVDTKVVDNLGSFFGMFTNLGRQQEAVTDELIDRLKYLDSFCTFEDPELEDPELEDDE